MIYRILVNEHKEHPPKEVVYKGIKVKRGHAVFVESDIDISQEAELIIGKEADDLPKFDRFGDEIVIKKIEDI